MYISKNWLGEFIDWNDGVDDDTIRNTLSEKVAEVEDVHTAATIDQQVVVGEILSIEPHPDADRVRVTQVRTAVDGESHQIICGAKNIEVGQRIPVALPGAVLPGDFVIAERELRGVMSCGMLCSARELGVGEDAEGIWILPEGTELGIEVQSLLGVPDTVYEFENVALTNRPDLFSHVGFARECVTAGLAQWKLTQDHEVHLTDDQLPVSLTVPAELCPYWAGVVISGVDTRPSPQWLQDRLTAVGERPINILVDITNYVMLELGMPMHAFDLNDISGDVQFRESEQGEQIVTLDDQSFELPAGITVMADEQGVFDLCGLMGGKRSSIQDSTKRVMLHAPVYPYNRIRQALAATGQRTMAATIYEKQVPPCMAEPAVVRAIEILQQVFGDDLVVESSLQTYGDTPQTAPSIMLQHGLIERMWGDKVDEARITTILRSLGCEVVADGNAYSVTPPLWRTRDITIPEDLAEEVLRHLGLSNVGMQPLVGTLGLPDRLPVHRARDELLSRALTLGINEFVTTPLIGAELLSTVADTPEESLVVLKNSVSEDHTIMRPLLLPRMLETLSQNDAGDAITLLEQGRVFRRDGQTVDETHMAELIWTGTEQSVARGQLEALLATLRPNDLRWLTTNDFPIRATQGAAILLRGQRIGSFALLPQSMLKGFGLSDRGAVFWAQLDLTQIAQAPQNEPQIVPLSRYPQVQYDIALLMPLTQEVGDVIRMSEKASKLLQDITVIEVYHGVGVPEGQKSVTLGFAFGADDRTLTHEEAFEQCQTVLQKLSKLNAIPRYPETLGS